MQLIWQPNLPNVVIQDDDMQHKISHLNITGTEIYTNQVKS